ncbi:MAG: DUF4300 family protein [Fenollaria massiliensis]
MKNILKILLTLSMALLFVSCAPKTNDHGNEASQVDKQNETPSDKDDDTIMYTNLSSDETKDELKNALLDKGLNEGDVDSFMSNLDTYNESADTSELASSFTKYSDNVTYNNSMDKFTEKNPDFLGINCRITTFSLMKNSMDVNKELEDKSSVLDFDKKAISDKSLLSEDEMKKFITYYAPINVKDEKANYEDLITKEFSERGIKFNNDKIKVISVYLNSKDEIDGNILFIGHTGLMYENQGKFYFLEKLSFQEPYQLLKFNSKKEIHDYLMKKYNQDMGEGTHEAIITENDKIFTY